MRDAPNLLSLFFPPSPPFFLVITQRHGRNCWHWTAAFPPERSTCSTLGHSALESDHLLPSRSSDVARVRCVAFVLLSAVIHFQNKLMNHMLLARTGYLSCLTKSINDLQVTAEHEAAGMEISTCVLRVDGGVKELHGPRRGVYVSWDLVRWDTADAEVRRSWGKEVMRERRLILADTGSQMSSLRRLP